MIKEAYVSSEVAKLLKEKGFSELCNRYLNSQFNEMRTVGDIWIMDFNSISEENEYISIPTQQMAVAWLREKYGISIEISALNQYQWVYAIYKLLKDSVAEVWNDGTYVSYEDATDDALKYCLENLNKLT
jgi:hypothetical protein